LNNIFLGWQIIVCLPYIRWSSKELFW
jgi:hypothetical protein